MSRDKVTRRRFLKGLAAAAGGTVLAACSPQVVKETVIVEKAVEQKVVETVVVEKAVEKKVVETVVVEKEVAVEKKVVETVVVTEERVVEKAVEKVVTATPLPCEIDWTPGMPPVFKKYDPVLEISIPFNADFTFKPGSSHTNNPWYNWTLENMGIKWVQHWEVPYGERQTKLQAGIAAGDMPDFINVYDPLFAQLVDDGAVKDIKEIFEATASPRVKEAIKYPDGGNFIHCFRNGRKELYGLDLALTDKVYSLNGFIRKDWLRKVGLTVPQTVQEWDEAVRAFNDAGLCEFGVAHQGQNLVGGISDCAKIFGAYGVMPTIWRDYGDGKLVYDSVSPANKDALAVLRKWYEDGLMDPDFPGHSWTEAYDTFAEGKAGIINFMFWGTGMCTVDVEGRHEGAEVDLLPLPKGPEGLRGQFQTKPVYHVWVFRHDLEDIKVEALINQLNYYIELHETGALEYQAYGALTGLDGMAIQGYDWDFDENCDVKMLEWSSGQEYRDVGFWHATYYGYQKAENRAKKKYLQADPKTLNKMEKYYSSNPADLRSIEAYEQLFDEEQFELEDKYYGIPSQNMRDLLPDLKKLEQEYFMGIVVGSKSLADFDEFVAEWRKAGGDEVQAEVNEWYDSTK